MDEKKIMQTKEESEKVVVKPSTKAMGLKSAFVKDNEVYFTSFGKGNKAILEKKITADEDVQTLSNPFSIEIENPKNGREYIVKNEKRHEQFEKYYKSKTNKSDNIKFEYASTNKTIQTTDALRRKPELEKRYFGKEFNDNIHIQLIYNIMDIRKILTVYANNIIFTLNNMRRDNDEKDIFGDISFRSSVNEKKYNELFDFPQLAYFGETFYNIQGNTANIKSREEIFKIYQILGTIRQIVSHENIVLKFKGDTYLSEQVLFNIEKYWTKEHKEHVDVIDSFYSKAIDKTNREFISLNKKTNFKILEKIYPNEKLENYILEFYDFTTRKSYKNLGFSVKQLRECIVKNKMPDLLDKKFDSVRSKLYTLMDFVIYRYFSQSKLNTIVENLRFAANDEEKKMSIYESESIEVYKELVKEFNIIKNNANGSNLKGLSKKKGYYSNLSEKISKNVKKPAKFVELIYFLNLFLDGKEINDLNTTLINKFDNIASLYDVIKNQLKLDSAFKEDYKIFENAAKIVEDLRVINSISRMQKALPNAQKVMYCEAFEVLNYRDADIKKYVDKVLCLEYKEAKVNKSEINNPKAISKAFGAYLPPENEKEYATECEKLLKRFQNAKLVEEDANTVTKQMSVKVDNQNGFRNFIASNVIESTRFQYLVRYCNPETVSNLAKNEKIVKFQLKRLPKEQLVRYYESCSGEKDGNTKERSDIEEYLTTEIREVYYDDFKDVVQDDRKSSTEEKKDKAKKQAIISLYLTILYIFVKNMVYVNSRYVMAFSCCDRDSCLYEISVEDSRYLDLTRKFLDEKFIKKSAATKIEMYMKLTNEDLSKKFRNKVCHLNVITEACNNKLEDFDGETSYYACYHYCLQKLLGHKLTEKTYDKNYVKAICSPFGYSLPRYKNLTTEEYFDKNDDQNKRK